MQSENSSEVFRLPEVAFHGEVQCYVLSWVLLTAEFSWLQDYKKPPQMQSQ